MVADGSSNHDEILYLDNDVQIHAWDNGIEDTTTPLTIINPGQTSSSQSYTSDNVTISAGIFLHGRLGQRRRHGR
jgi:hypothetical protein